MADTSVRRIRLAQVPAELVMRERDHLDSLMRELYGSELLDHDTSRVAGRLAALMDGVLTKAAPVRDACWTAARSGDQVTVETEVRPDEAQALDGILIVLEQAEAFCQEERLYARPAPAEVAELRAWMAEEVRRQLAGSAPSPCPVRFAARSSMVAQAEFGGGGVATLAPPSAPPAEPVFEPSPDAWTHTSASEAPTMAQVVELAPRPEPRPAASDPAPAPAVEPPSRSSWWDR